MGTDRRTIRSYNKHAAAWAKRIRSGENLAHTYLEKPAMYKALPDLKGKSVLCMGCGSGEECQYLRSSGARRVTGIDASKGLIEHARRSFPDIDFHVMDMERLKFPPASFDVVYSSLALEYVPDWLPTLKNVYRVLRDGGTFLFSAHHPIKWGAQIQRNRDGKKILMGYELSSRKKWKVYGDYHRVRKIHDQWFGNFDSWFYHQPLESSVRAILKAGFTIVDFIEPKPVPSVKKKDIRFWSVHLKIPQFLILVLRK